MYHWCISYWIVIVVSYWSMWIGRLRRHLGHHRTDNRCCYLQVLCNSCAWISYHTFVMFATQWVPWWATWSHWWVVRHAWIRWQFGVLQLCVHICSLYLRRASFPSSWRCCRCWTLCRIKIIATVNHLISSRFHLIVILVTNLYTTSTTLTSTATSSGWAWLSWYRNKYHIDPSTHHTPPSLCWSSPTKPSIYRHKCWWGCTTTSWRITTYTFSCTLYDLGWTKNTISYRRLLYPQTLQRHRQRTLRTEHDVTIRVRIILRLLVRMLLTQISTRHTLLLEDVRVTQHLFLRWTKRLILSLRQFWYRSTKHQEVR